MAGYENYGIESGKLVDPSCIPHFLEISEPFSDNMVPLLDQNTVSLRGITADQQHWRNYGYVIKRNFIDHALIDEYIEIRRKLNLGSGQFPTITPYLDHSVIRDICCSLELNHLLVDLLGEELGVHFLLADFKSSERGWHQDDYLNPADTMARYAAVWMAMGDIDPDSGPFEFVPGSHKWPCLRRDKVKALVAPEVRETGDHTWAVVAEYFVNKSVDAYIKETGAEVARLIARKGDVLIWHGKLVHRGSIPINSNLLRPAIIAHYSSIRSRRDFGAEIARHKEGGYFWEFSTLGRPLTKDQFPRITRVAERDGLSAPGDAVTRERDAAVAERDALAAAHDAVTRERDAVVAERNALATASKRWFDAVIAVTPDHNPLAQLPRKQHSWWRKRARRLTGEHSRLMVLANRARDAGKWELAVRYYRDALDGAPDDPEIWAQCGRALTQAGMSSEAEVAHQKSRELTARYGQLGSTDAIADADMLIKTSIPRLPANGAQITLIGLGTSFLRDAECVRATETALSLGYRHIDTAVMYGNEAEVGNAIRSSGIARGDLFITTKVLPEEIGEGDLQRSAAGSLERLRLDYLDLLLLHWPNSAIPLSISVKALCDAKKLGLTRHIGVSNFPTKLLEEAVSLAADHGERLVANQCEYHPRLNQTKLLEACRANGIAFISHSPLGHGRLHANPTLVTIARRLGKTPAQVLLRWNIQQPGIAAVVKSVQPARLAENLQVFDFELSDEDMNDLFAMASADGRMVYPVNTPVPEWDPPIAITAAASGRNPTIRAQNRNAREDTPAASRADGTTNSISAISDAVPEMDKDGFVENVFAHDLERFVKAEAFHFDKNATEWYFEPAEETMDIQWQHVQSFLSKHPIDYTNTLELSCGHGRNSEKLATLSKDLVLVDVVPDNIVFCRNRFPDKPWRFVINNGFDLREIANDSITFVYCFEAAVHFDLEIILSYIKEFHRVLTPSAFGFVHHSNVTANPGKDWRTIPHGRNFMSKEIFAHLCVHNGLEIVDQHIFHQGGPEADCFSLFRKNAP